MQSTTCALPGHDVVTRLSRGTIVVGELQPVKYLSIMLAQLWYNGCAYLQPLTSAYGFDSTQVYHCTVTASVLAVGRGSTSGNAHDMLMAAIANSLLL